MSSAIKTMIMPNVRFPGFSSNWKKDSLENLVTNKSKKLNPKSADKKIKCIELEHLSQESGSLLGFSWTDETESIKNVFDKGAVLFGKLRPYLKKYWHASFDGVCSSEIWVLSGKKISNNYLYQLVQTSKFDSVANISSGSKMPRSDWDYMSSVPFCYPEDKDEQEKIGSFLLFVDIWNESLEKQKKSLEEYKKGMMQLIFSQKIRFKDGNGNDYPKWNKQKLSHYLVVSKKRNNQNFFSKKDVLSVSGDYGIVNQIEFQGRSFAGKSVKNYGVVENGDIVYTKSPLKSNPYGIIKSNKGNPGIVSTLYAVYKCKSNIDSTFLDYYFQLADNTNKYLRPLVHKGAKNDMKISDQKFLTDFVIFPDLSEQRKIVNYFELVDKLIDSKNNQIKKAKEWKKGLLQQMFV